MIAALADGGVDYVLIGGLAVGAHGFPRATKDLDIVPAPDEANLRRLAGVLRAIDARHFRVAKSPAAVQAALFAPLAAIARRTGRDPLAAELHGPAAACAIVDPGEDGLAALLARRGGARAARGRG